jgi:diketogulonate reductase-like aldo/keto reductase
MTNHPWFIYGTAWKKERTTELVEAAVREGFTAIDTANQPKHYSESLVGEALKRLAESGITREKLFLQTKFTPLEGQDNRVPYDMDAGLPVQVRQSFQSSLEHLGTNYVDSYLLHGPYNSPDLGDEDWEVWASLEEIHRAGHAKRIGISNVNAQQLETLVARASVKPMVVQNRCYVSRGWDKEVREVCKKHGIAYQGFSLLTANPQALRHRLVEEIANRLVATPEQILFRFAVQVGIIPLTGTTDRAHMAEDLEVARIKLTGDEMRLLENV